MSLESNSQCVTSKYFECKTVMDESLLDFQENKQNHKGPKVTQKVTKTKIKKAIKHIKGQKDIRKVLQKNKSDIISYSKEFDKVCKKSGLDVDSEQLQLAIALSKSLQTESEVSSSSQQLTAKGRLAKIRTTLQEYGFKVPDAKISTNKKIKKSRKVYKLITISEDERHQKVTNKYAKVLLDSFDVPKLNENNYNDESKSPIFHLASNLSYESMRDNYIFHVKNLLEKSTTSGYMLRDWAEIPGRPVSPIIQDNNTMDFKELSYSQNELDVILSSSIKSAKNIVATKRKSLKREAYNIIENGGLVNENYEINNHDNEDCIENNEDINFRDTPRLKIDFVSSTNKSNNIIDLESTSSNGQNRCDSPDLFEDDITCTIPPSVDTSTKCLSQSQKTKIFTESINCMDLTACVNNTYVEKTLYTSQDKTKRKSNDFMDFTQCAVSVSQGIQKEEIDLTKSPDDETLNLEATMVPVVILSPKNDNSIQTSVFTDLIQSKVEEQDKAELFNEEMQVDNSISDKNKIIKDMNTTALANDTIDLTQSYKEEKNISVALQTKCSEEFECMDLTQSSKSSTCLDDLPEIKLYNMELQSNPDDTIILKEEEYISINVNGKKAIVEDEQIDLTQSLDESVEQDDQEKIYESFYDDFVHEHSDSNENAKNDTDSVNVHKIDEIIYTDRPISNESFKTTSGSTLGKRDDDISIDYDEVSEYNNQRNAENRKEENDSLEIQISNDINNSDNFNDPDSSQPSEIFDLTDKELDYSMHKSKNDNIENCNNDFGDISVMDCNNSGVNSEIYLEKRITRKDFIPISNNSKTPDSKSMNFTELNDNNSNPLNPSGLLKDICKDNGSTNSLLTPNNSEYIIKTNEITPMLNYESMTTPQRNKELDKYGLRPFKRKRAIQILTHLYNQTHPVIEPYLDSDKPLSSKKSKLENEPSSSSSLKPQSPSKPLSSKKSKLENEPSRSSLKLQSPRKPVISESYPSPKKNIIKKSKSPRKISENKKENSPRKKEGSFENVVCTNHITSDVPIIKNLDCNPEDWVFQKKEKAKVYSCRVPLHIVFHNYVSSRRNLREAILKYEPVNIDIIHKDLVSYGYRYDPKDLLKFLDKKCITVKTADNNARNSR